MKLLDIIAAAVLVIGGLNWGLVGAFEFNLVTAVFGDLSVLSRSVFVLVAGAALYQTVALPLIQSRWKVKPALAKDYSATYATVPVK